MRVGKATQLNYRVQKLFSKAGTLGRYLHMHTGEKPHPCKEYEKSLKNHEILKNHMFADPQCSGEKSQRCTKCKKSIQEGGDLRAHLHYSHWCFFCLCMRLMRIKIFTCAWIRIYAHHPHEPHGSATAWPTLVQPKMF